MIFKRLLDKNEQLNSIITTRYSSVYNIDQVSSLAIQCKIDVDTPAAATFDSGELASVVIQDLTYTADTAGTAGNSITIEYTTGGTAGSEVVSVVGTAISVQIEDGVSTATQIKTAVDAEAGAAALVDVTVSGTGSNAQSAVAATNLADGANTEVDQDDDQVTIPSHGFTTGLKGQLTTTGTLPAGLATATDYYIISVDTNTVKFASSLANAQAGTAVDITDDGSDGGVHTFTPTSIAGATVVLQKSNIGTDEEADTDWSSVGSATNITADGNVWLEVTHPGYKYMRIKYTITAGRMSTDNYIITRG